MRILSRRKFEHRTFWQLVFEWEDELHRSLSLPVATPGKASWFARYGLNMFRSLLPMRSGNLIFEMKAAPINYGRRGPGDVVVMVDYFLDSEETARFLKSVRGQRLVLITSKEAHEFILAHGGDPKQIRHWALSLPDKYAVTPDTTFEKEYDVVFIGRTSQEFQDYLERYQAEHGQLRVLHRRIENRKYNYYTPDGEFAVNADDREGYWELLRKTRVLLYLTPGMGGEKATNGFSQVTPRFLEALSAGCNIIMKYPDNADTRYYELDSFSPSVDTYEEFERQMTKALFTPPMLRA